MNDEIVIYRGKHGDVKLKADFRDDTVWATQEQIAQLFDVDRSGVVRHINNVYKTNELKKNATCAKIAQVQIEGSRKVKREVPVFNLDMILSIGYRVNSAKATEFRKWANSVLEEYLLKGVAINQRRLNELNFAVELLKRSEIDEISGVASVLANYTDALKLLSDYDENKLSAPRGKKGKWELTHAEARKFLDSIEFGKSNTNFACERNGSFKGILEALYQTFDGKDLYSTVEEKAANLLYLVVKDHPFLDGNKRSAAALFVYFLDRNNALNDKYGRQIIANNTLAAMTLMTALSQPKEKEQIILLIMNLLVGGGK